MLKANSLYFQRNGQYVLQDISFEVKAGSCLIVRGANGAGKSTLLRLIAGFMIPNSGSISLHGKFINDDLDYFSENIEYIGHSYGVKRSMSVIETINLWNSLYGNPSSKLPSTLRIDEIKNQLISHCSAGQIQRLSLSRLELTKKKNLVTWWTFFSTWWYFGNQFQTNNWPSLWKWRNCNSGYSWRYRFCTQSGVDASIKNTICSWYQPLRQCS